MSGDAVKDDLKFPTPDDVRTYLQAAQTAGTLAAAFATAQVPEGATAAKPKAKPKAKPSALHFTSGKMRFLEIARGIVTGANNQGNRTGHAPLSVQNVQEAFTQPGNGLTLLRWATPTDVSTPSDPSAPPTTADKPEPSPHPHPPR